MPGGMPGGMPEGMPGGMPDIVTPDNDGPSVEDVD